MKNIKTNEGRWIGYDRVKSCYQKAMNSLEVNGCITGTIGSTTIVFPIHKTRDCELYYNNQPDGFISWLEVNKAVCKRG